jgi:hypothetical protein
VLKSRDAGSIHHYLSTLSSSNITEEYSFAEFTDMLLIYGEAQGNGRAARRLYEERFPGRRMPAHTMFARVVQRLRDTGCLKVNKHDDGGGARRNMRTPEV